MRKTFKKELEQNQAKLNLQQKLSQQVLDIIQHSEYPAHQNFTLVCAQMGVSESTVRRKLAEEDTSFKGIYKYWFYQEAVFQLISTDKKIDAIALELGYSERSAFDRAFKRTLGTSAAKFREVGQDVDFKATDIFNITIDDLPTVPQSS